MEKKMILIILILIQSIVLSNDNLNSQMKNSQSIYLELLGQGGFGSVNYASMIGNSSISIRAGIGVIGYLRVYYTCPLGIYYYPHNNLRWNIGIVNTFINRSNITFSQSIWLGYEDVISKKTIVRIGLACNPSNNLQRIIPGFSIGINF